MAFEWQCHSLRLPFASSNGRWLQPSRGCPDQQGESSLPATKPLTSGEHGHGPRACEYLGMRAFGHTAPCSFQDTTPETDGWAGSHRERKSDSR
jgi:hypothetical protein